MNVRFDSHWASLGPKLQPVLSDRSFRQGSEERYLPVRGGFVVSQTHQGPAGTKHVFRAPGQGAKVFYQPPPAKHRTNPDSSDADPEVSAAAGLVTDAYSMFLFGPGFFAQRGAAFQKVAATADVDGRACDELVTTLRPGLGSSSDKVVLFIDRPANLPAHEWSLLGFDTNRGESPTDLAGPAFKGKAATPSKPVVQ